MKYYWDELYEGKRVLVHLLQQDTGIYDCSDEPSSEGMASSYPSYKKRDFRLYQFGSCVGYTTLDIIQGLVEQGYLYPIAEWPDHYMKVTDEGIKTLWEQVER